MSHDDGNLSRTHTPSELVSLYAPMYCHAMKKKLNHCHYLIFLNFPSVHATLDVNNIRGSVTFRKCLSLP